MKPGRLLIAAVLLAALAGALWWSNRDEKAKEGKPAADAPPKILEIKPDSVKQIDIKRHDGESTSVRFNDKGKWEITSPKPLVADSTSVAQLTNALSSLTSDRLVDPNATDLAGYGLAPAVLEVDVATKDGKTTQLLIGEATPTGNNVYAKLGGDPRLFTMPSSNKATFDKTSKDLREKHLLAFTGGKLLGLGLTINGKGGPQTIEFGRVGETDWEITKPKKMRADGTPVDDIISKLKLTEMDVNLSEEDAKKAAASFASAPLTGIIKVIDSTATQSLEVRKIKDDYYAKSSAIDGVYKIGKDLGDALGKPLDDYRNKKLFDFAYSDPNRIVLQDGGKTTTYEKIKDKWMSAGKEMDSTNMQAFIDRLRDLSASKFLDSGFTKPAITLTVASNDGKRTETLDIAPAASGPNYIAQRRGEEGFYEIDRDAVQQLRGAAADVKEVQAKKK
jgi:ribosomal protein L12E/L44/L45/RPP1/RPP2